MTESLQERIDRLEEELNRLKNLKQNLGNVIFSGTVGANDNVLHLVLEDGEVFIKDDGGNDIVSSIDGTGYDDSSLKWLLWNYVDKLARDGVIK
jgi:hypothetical protein